MAWWWRWRAGGKREWKQSQPCFILSTYKSCCGIVPAILLIIKDGTPLLLFDGFPIPIDFMWVCVPLHSIWDNSHLGAAIALQDCYTKLIKYVTLWHSRLMEEASNIANTICLFLSFLFWNSRSWIEIITSNNCNYCHCDSLYEGNPEINSAHNYHHLLFLVWCFIFSRTVGY